MGITKEQFTEIKWTNKIAEGLVGKKIIGISYLSKKKAKEYYWYERPVVIRLDDGTVLIPMSDDEGNSGGAIATNIKGLETIPVMR